MTLEERLEKLEKQIKDQNSYITKLEGENKELKEKPQSRGTDIDPKEYEFIKQKTLRREMLEDKESAKKELVSEYGDEVFKLLEAKYDEFSKTQITPETSSVQFFKSTFELVFAREMKKKDGELYKFYNKEEEPKPTPQTNDDEGNVNENPPTLTENDPSSSDPNFSERPKVKDLSDSFSALRKTLAGESNPYE